MAKLIDKIVLLICSIVFLNFTYDEITFWYVLGLLLVFCISSLLSYLGDGISKTAIYRYWYIGLLIVYGILCFVHPIFTFYLPLIFYDIFVYKQGVICFVLTLALLHFRYRDLAAANYVLFIFIALSALLSWRTHQFYKVQGQLRNLRDETTEYNLRLKDRNRDLMEKQDYEIHLATLKERNRIAREIHDNVGHMLSRSLLQLGALQAICQEEAWKGHLHALKDTLSGAMDSVRSSVHDLHDESVDLEAAVKEILSDFKEYHLDFDYDMGNNIPRKIKYCLISIIKEGMSNISKHSNGDSIRLILREHPSMYQLLLEDNGTKQTAGSDGIGLENMKTRVTTLQGSFNAGHQESGFRIFLTIPRQR